jgi:hypothetical protein
MNPISGAAPFPSSLLRLGARSFSDNRQSERSASETTLLNALKDSDPEKAKVLGELLDARDTVRRQFETMPKPSEQRKARAREKIEEIKQKLQALRMLANINPKAAARQAAQLAKELSSAVKQYTGGGSALSDIGMNASQPVISSDASASVSSDAPPASVPATPTATQNDIAAPEATVSSVAPVGPANGDAPPQPGTATDGSGNSSPEDSADEGSPSTQAQAALGAIREKLNAEIAKRDEAFGENKADTDFASTVEKIKSALKSILDAAKRKLKESDDPETQNAVDQGLRALQDVDASLNGLNGVTPATASVNILI